VRQLQTTRVAAGQLPSRWLAAQRPSHHFLVRCRRGGFASVAADVMALAAPPIRLCPLPGPLHLPSDRRGTLLLNDVATLAFADQIALYEWLGAGTGDLRIISVTAAPLAALVARVPRRAVPSPRRHPVRPRHREVFGMNDFERELACAARLDIGVLITGVDESEDRAVAAAIHRRSRRAIAPFFTVNCGHRPEHVVESTLFGRGSESAADATRGCLELAHGGTVFLANIDAASARLQSLLLRFLESGEIRRVGQDCVHRKVDVRVIASIESATPADGAEFSVRDDLFYRLNALHLVVPMHRLDDSLYKQWLNATRLQTVCA
jgi:hypothetical protein